MKVLDKNKLPQNISIFLLCAVLIVPISYAVGKNLTILILYVFLIMLYYYWTFLKKSNYLSNFIISTNFIITAFLLIYSILSFILYQHYEIDYLKTTYFIIILFIFNQIEENKYYLVVGKNSILFIFLIHLFSSYLVFFLEEQGFLERQFIHRFMGFHLSPTTFAMYTSGFFIITFYCLSNKVLKLVLYFLTLFLIQASATRINVIFFLGIFPLLFSQIINVRKLYFIITVFFTIMFIYPLFMGLEEIANAALGREEDTGNESGSTAERLFILGEQIKIIQNSTFTQHFFGQGPESCYDIFSYLNDRPEVSERVKDGKNGWTHFDYTRIYIEFGFFFTLAFFKYLFTNFTITKLSTLLLLNYFISFYHNGYNDPLNFLILCCGRYIKINK